jgi:cysteine-rich repeat protein
MRMLVEQLMDAIAPAAVCVVLAAMALQPAAARAAQSSTSPRLRESTIVGPESLTTQHAIVVGLDLRNRDELERLLADIENPRSPNYRKFISQEEFNDRFAPSGTAEQRMVDHLHASGLVVTQRFRNRLLIPATGSVAALDRAFGVQLKNVSFRGESHYAALSEPTFPDDLAPHVAGVIGLDDLVRAHPHVRFTPSAIAPKDALGSYCCSFSPNDLKVFYDNDGTYDGTGQTVVIAGAYAWFDSDVANFNAQWGLPSLPADSAQVCTGGLISSGCQMDFGSANLSFEATLDVEYAHGTAPGARILNYMAVSLSLADFTVMYNAIVNDNRGHVVTTSWGSCEAETSTAAQRMNDTIFANANAIGQSWFAASGDSGSRDCSGGINGILSVDHPANSPHVIGVGGTTAACSSDMTPGSPACQGYGSETGWSGSGGGVSNIFERPHFQAGCGVPAAAQRLVPDVALEASQSPGNFVREGGEWWTAGGTSIAAPQWAGILAALNQKAGGTAGIGNPGQHLYGLCGTNAFHDIIGGSNGDYGVSANYDLVTGIGTVDISNFLTHVPQCGDGIVDVGEQCDDGNTISGDGCSASCESELSPGGGPRKTDCYAEWLTNPVGGPDRHRLPANRLECTDDNPLCDFGTAPGDKACTFHVAVCFNAPERRFACGPTDVTQVQLKSPQELHPKGATDSVNRDALEAALTGLSGSLRGRCANPGPHHGQLCAVNSDCDSTPDSGNGVCTGRFVAFAPPLATTNACTAFAEVLVPLRRLSTGAFVTGRKTLKLRAIASSGLADNDSLTLICHPQP